MEKAWDLASWGRKKRGEGKGEVKSNLMFSLMRAERQVSRFSGGRVAEMGTGYKSWGFVWEQASVEHSVKSVPSGLMRRRLG